METFGREAVAYDSNFDEVHGGGVVVVVDLVFNVVVVEHSPLYQVLLIPRSEESLSILK